MKKDHDIKPYRARISYSSGLLHEKGISLAQLIKNEKNTILPSPYFYLFYDYQLSKTLYISPSAEKLYGISREVIRDDEEHLLFDMILKDEQPAVTDLVTGICDDHYHRGEKYLSDRVFSLEFRVQRTNCDILHMLCQNEVLNFTKDTLPKLILVRFVDLSWLFESEKERIVKFYIYNSQTNEIEYYTEKLVSKEAAIRLTSREEEVQDLIDFGYTSNQITEKLDISTETVKTHRKNIKVKQADA